MKKLLLGAFTDPRMADRAVSELEALGYDSKDVQVIIKTDDYGVIGVTEHTTGANAHEIFERNHANDISELNLEAQDMEESQPFLVRGQQPVFGETRDPDLLEDESDL